MVELSAEQDLRFHKVCSLDDLWAGEMQMFESRHSLNCC